MTLFVPPNRYVIGKEDKQFNYSKEQLAQLETIIIISKYSQDKKQYLIGNVRVSFRLYNL